jgi:chromosomal replication initiation ATPase DnaA
LHNGGTPAHPSLVHFIKNEDRDLAVYSLRERGVLRNDDIGSAFGLSYSTVSHIVRDVKERMNKDQQFRKKVQNINSQFKM